MKKQNKKNPENSAGNAALTGKKNAAASSGAVKPPKKEKKPRKEAPLIVQTIVLCLVLAAAVYGTAKVTAALFKDKFKATLTDESSENLASYRGTYRLSQDDLVNLNTDSETVSGMLDYFGDTITVTDSGFEIAGVTCPFSSCTMYLGDEINSIFLENGYRDFSYESLTDSDGNALSYPVTIETSGIILGADYRLLRLRYGTVTLLYRIETE